MPWQTNFTNRLTQNRARFGITSANRSGGSLTDAVIKRAIADPAWGRTYLQRRGLEDEDIDRILKNESDPGFLAKAFGWMDVLDAPVRALSINKGRAEIEDRRGDTNILEGLARNVGNAAIGPLGIFKGTLWDRPETVLNPLEEMGKAVKGEQAASFTSYIEDLSDEKFLSQGERDLYGNEVFQFVAGTGMDIAGSPTTYGSSGLTSATKAARAQKVAELVEGGVNAAKIADLGMDVAEFASKYGDEFAQGQRAFGSKADDVLDLAKRLEKGVSYTELPQAARNELFDASTRWAMNSVGGTQRKLGVPFTREVLDEAGQATGRYAAGGFKPAIEDITKDAAGTIFERMGKQPTLKTWGATGAQKTINLGKRAVDKGGLKLFGQTVLDVQPMFEGAARAVWTGANSIDLYTKAKSLVNRYAEVDAFGDRMFSTYLRVRSGDLDAARQVARQLAVKRGVELGEQLDVRDANRLGARIEDVLPREAMARASELRKAKQDEMRQIDVLVKKLGAYDEEHIASIRGAAAGDALKSSAKLEELATLQADAADELASGLERLGLPQSTAEALRASAASLRGRQQGLDTALVEVQRASRQAKSDLDKFVNRSAGLRESAKLPVFGGADTTAQATNEVAAAKPLVPEPIAAPAFERPPATLDEFIETTYTPTRLKAEGDESTTRFIDDMKTWLQSHQVETTYTDAAGVPVDFTEEYMQAIGELPGYKTYRSARKGTQKARYEAFADQLRQMGDMYGIPSISQAGDDHATVAAFGDLLRGGGRDVNLKTADDVIAAFGEDAFVDDILERARVAQEAGDMEAAQAWTDFAEEFTRRMETSTFDELAQDPWAAPMAKTAPEPEVVTQTEMPVARKPRQQRVSDVRQKLDDAYARGLVRGRRESARTAVGDAWEAAARSRKAEGREASILEKMAALGDDEARARYAYKQVSKLETEIANIKRQAAVQSDRFRRGATEYDRVERTLALIDAKRAKVEDLDAQIKAIFDEADYGRMERILIEEDGYTPERAHELRLIAEEIRDDLEMSQAAKRAVGRGEVDLLTGQGSTGYTPSMGVGEQPFFENMRRAIDEKTGGKLPVFSPEYRARAEVTEDVFGRPYSELNPAGQKHGGARGGRSIRPKTPDGREYMTKAERIEAGLQTELDVRHTIPSKLQADADLIAKTRFEDSVLGSSGRRMEFDVEEIAERTGQSVEEVERKVVPEGWVRKRIERDSGNYDVIIPEVLDKWVKTYEDVFISSEAANTFARGFDRIQNTLKSMMTVWNPSFHMRNMPSNYFLAFAQELGDPDSWIEGHRAFAAVLAGEGDKVMIHVGDATMSATELVESLRGQVIRGIGGSTDIGQATLRMIDQATPRENILGELRRTLSPTRVGQEVGDATENAARASVYLAARNKGLTHEAAMLLPDKVLYNYMPENMTAFEREVVKRIIPFYAWLKQNLPQQIENMLKNPGRIGWLGKMRNAAFDATDIDPTLLPEWMRDLGMMPLPAGEGEENLMWNPSQVPWQDLQRLGAGSKELAGMVSPVIKSPFELMANYDFYRQRDIEGYEYEGERAPGYLTLADNLMGGNPLWESLKEKAHMTYHVDDATGEQYLVVPGKLRKAMRDFMPFAENIGRMVGERPAAYDARSKDTFNALAYATGIRLSPMDEDYYSDQQVRRLRSAIGDELQRLRDEGKL